MALSGSRDFTLTRNLIIEDALRTVNAIPLGATPTGNQVVEASRVLNTMVKSWQSRGVYLWTEDWVEVELVADTAEYALSATILDLRLVYRRDDTTLTDDPVTLIRQPDYASLGQKDDTGDAWAVVFNRTLTPSITVYPTPADGSYTLRLLAEYKLQDFDAPSDNPDFPTNWLNALIAGLAYKLSFRYQVPLDERALLAAEAEKEFREAKSKSQSEREDEPFIAPAI